MAIPGRSLDKVDTRAKVRVGIKAPRKPGGPALPQSVNYFVCDDPEVAQLAGDKPKVLSIVLPFATADECFSTGLEWWKGKLLACYTHEGGSNPVALRIAQANGINLLDGDDDRRGEQVGQGRQPITCRADACKHFGRNADNKECRPMGRLQFFLEGGRTDSALQLDTKGWNTIEQIASALKRAETRDLRALRWQLHVEMVKKGRDQYPLVTIKEAPTPINTPTDVEKAEALRTIEAAFAADDTIIPPLTARVVLASALDLTNPGWKLKPAIIDKIKEVGPDAALASMRKNLTAALA